MPRFDSYQAQARDRHARNLLLGGGAAAGLAVLAFVPGARRALGRGLLRAGAMATRALEEGPLFYGGAAARAEARTAAAVSSLDAAVSDFTAFRNFHLPRQAMRDAAEARLVGQGWEPAAARRMLEPTGQDLDVFSASHTPEEILAHPFYHARIPAGLSPAQAEQDLLLARTDASVHRQVTPEMARHSSALFAARLMRQVEQDRASLAGRVRRAFFGAQRLTLAHDTGDPFLTHLGGVRWTPSARAEEDFARFMAAARTGREQVWRRAHDTTATLYYHLKQGGAADPLDILRRLPTGRYDAGAHGVLDVGRLLRLSHALEERFAEHFHIPVVPGGLGIQPLRLFPWSRGRVPSPFVTLAAGTHQEELARAGLGLAPTGRLARDVHGIDGRLFTTGADGSIRDLPGRWDIRDARHGFWKEFARIRRDRRALAEREGSVRAAVGDGYAGRALDALGLGRQAEPSRLSRAADLLRRWLRPGDPAYAGHPTHVYGRVLEAGADAARAAGGGALPDVQRLLGVVTTKGRLSDRAARLLFADALEPGRLPGLTPGLAKLHAGGLPDEDVAIALREIHAIARDEPVASPRFFQPADRLRARRTRAYATRFAQDDVGTLAETLHYKDIDSAAPWRGLVGAPDPLTGFGRARQVLYEETLAQIARAPASGEELAGMLRRVAASDLPDLEKRETHAYLWAYFQQQRLAASVHGIDLRAAAIAEELAANPELQGSLGHWLHRRFGPLVPHVDPQAAEEEMEGVFHYALPARRGITPLSIVRAAGEALRGRTLDPLRALARESVPGLGDAANPGFFYHGAHRMNRMLAGVGLGLPDRMMETGGAAWTNLFARRALPALAGIEAWKYGNHLAHALHLPGADDLIAHARANAAVAGSWLADHTGMTPFEQHLSALSPGTEDYWQPRSEDEMRDFLDHGYSPVRRNRFWFVGSRGAWVGDKIDYWAPSWYRQATSHWQEASNVDLNSSDYWAHSLLPTPTHPLSPITHFTDPYWFERKHARDRPYVMSGEMFDPNWVGGALGNATLGPLLKPHRTLHPEYLPENVARTIARADALAGSQDAGLAGSQDAGLAGRGPRPAGGAGAIYWQKTGRPEVFEGDPAFGDAFATQGAPASQPDGAYGSVEALASATSPRGEPRARALVRAINQAILARGDTPAPDSLAPGPGGARRPSAQAGYRPARPVAPEAFAPRDQVEGPDGFAALGQLYYNRRHALGFYGFLEELAHEHLTEPALRARIQQPNRAMGLERRFWDPAYGGLGGEISEFWRRILPHRDRRIAEYNPVPNDQPDWLPGDDYYLNLRRGDPYVQIHRGELRLPGEAYERSHGLRRPRGAPAGTYDWYPDTARLEILGDVAPYSNEYRAQLAGVRARLAGEEAAGAGPEDLRPDQDRVNATVHRAAEAKKRVRIRDRRFSERPEARDYHVERVIDANTIQVQESPNPLRLAGVRASAARASAAALKALNVRVAEGQRPIEALYGALGLTPGAPIRAYVNPGDPISPDLLETRRADIQTADGVNFNRALLTLGVGVERPTDRSPAGLRARFSPLERAYGRAWEALAHLDTPLNSKFLNVRSAYEHYVREQVYGTQAATWTHPVRDWARPTLDAIASRTPVWAALTGAFVGSLFGRTRTATLVGAALGAGVGAAASLGRGAAERATGRPWIPGRVRKRRALEEYIDALKFVKMTRLAAQEAARARAEEGIDPDRLIERERRLGEGYRRTLRGINARKRLAKLFLRDPAEADATQEAARAEARALEASAGEAGHYGPHTLRAVMFARESHATLAGAEPGTALPQVAAALPKYEREIALDLLGHGTAREKKRFWRLLPDAEKTALAPYFDRSAPPPKDLPAYFREHTLPDLDWGGWQEEFPLDAIRTRAAEGEGVSMNDLGLYPRNVAEARVLTEHIPVPTLHGRTRHVEETLGALLRGQGVSNVAVTVSVAPSHQRNRIRVEADLEHDRTDEYLDHL